MNPDDIERVLLSETRIEPSPKFAEDVIRRIQADAMDRHAKPFPWFPFAASMLILTILSIRLFPVDLILRNVNSFSQFIAGCITAPRSVFLLHSAIIPASASILGSLLLVWLSLRLAGAEN
jgi:hypothetical protein